MYKTVRTCDTHSKRAAPTGYTKVKGVIKFASSKRLRVRSSPEQINIPRDANGGGWARTARAPNKLWPMLARWQAPCAATTPRCRNLRFTPYTPHSFPCCRSGRSFKPTTNQSSLPAMTGAPHHTRHASVRCGASETGTGQLLSGQCTWA